MEKYEKLRVIGRGAYGIVYLCNRKEDKKKVILKQISVDELSKEEKQASLNEAKVLAMLDHPNIIAYYDNFLEDKSITIVMEYASGGTLLEYLLQRNEILLPEEEVLNYFAQMILALQHVHFRQILHRDLKSQNIFMNEKQNLIKLGDFGISKILITKSKACTVVGTPCYISPELCEGKPYNQRSDIWSLGCVLYELLTLKKPFEASNLPALVGQIMKGIFEPVATHYSTDLRQLLKNMLATDPSKRPLIAQIMAQPCLVSILYPLYLHIGSISKTTVKCNQSPTTSSLTSTKTNLGETSFSFSDLKTPKMNPNYHYEILKYTSVSKSPETLHPPSNDVEIKSIAFCQPNLVILNKSHTPYIWKDCTSNNECNNFSYCFPQDQISIYIVQIACGKNFVVLLTNRGLVMTFGKGSSYCLGHGDKQDILKPKIVECLLGMDVIHIACGSEHVMVVTKEGLLFAWGKGGNGRLGLNGFESHLLPQKLQLNSNINPSQVICSEDSTFLITKNSALLATGNNRHNKLGIDNENGISIDESSTFLPVCSSNLAELKIKAVSSGITHTAVLTDCGQCFTFGSNKWGQLGWGKTGMTHNMAGKIVMQDDELDTFMQISCGSSFTVAVGHSKGQIFLWGKSGCYSNMSAYNLILPELRNSPIVQNCSASINEIVFLIKAEII